MNPIFRVPMGTGASERTLEDIGMSQMTGCEPGHRHLRRRRYRADL